MNIIISNSGDTPIYEQISSQIKEKIMTGRLKPGDALPSMRLLAKELRISVITTKRAYEELERDGFIVTMTGRGSFVSENNAEKVRNEYLKRIKGYIEEAVRLSSICGISEEDLSKMISLIWEENKYE